MEDRGRDQYKGYDKFVVDTILIIGLHTFDKRNDMNCIMGIITNM